MSNARAANRSAGSRRGDLFLVAILAFALTLALASRAEARIYWANSGTSTIGRAGLDGSGADQSFVPGELLVRFRSGVGARARSSVLGALDATTKRRLPLPGLQLVRIGGGESVPQAVAAFERRPQVRYAEPNFIYRIEATPNDPRFGELWGLDNSGQSINGISGSPDADIDAPEAWDTTTGSSAVTVAVVDTGVAYDHPDLAPNIRTNPGESGLGKESNGVDDDGNGFVDDWRGWDFVDSDNDPRDLHHHGTHVAGTIGARGDDGQGVTGVNWQVGLLPVRVCDPSGECLLSDVASGFAYAGANGAKVANASLGGPEDSQAPSDAITGAPNTLFVVSAGNNATNNEANPHYPCNYSASNLVCVAATTQSDDLASFSDYGAASVDLGAPGTNVLSAYPGNGFSFLDGTSMASPHVAGAAALLWAQEPAISPNVVKSKLLSSVDPLPALAGKTVSGGRLNVYRALGGSPPFPVFAPDTQIDSGPSGPTNDNTPTFTFSSNEQGASFECRLDSSQEADFQPCTSPLTTGPLPDGPHSFEVRATDAGAHTDPSPASASFTVDTVAPDTSIDSGPAAGSTTGDNTPTFTFSSEQGTSFECRLDGVFHFSSCKPPHYEDMNEEPSAKVAAAEGSFTPFSPLSDGPHSLEVRATDAARNTDPSPASRSFTVDATPPDTSIDSGPTGPTNDPSPTFNFSSEQGASFECRLDGDGYAACTSPLTTGPLPDGPHSFEVRATDAGAHTDPSPASASFTVDTVAPDASIESGPTGLTNDNTPTFAFSSGEQGASFECRFDGGAFSACSSPLISSPLSDGPHSFEVRATDVAANTDPSPASASFTVDTVAPDASIESGPTGLTNDNTPTFAFSSGEQGASFECRFDGGAFSACSSPLISSPLSDGPHSFEVRATDVAANTDPSPASRSFTVDATPPDTSIESGPTGLTNDNTPTFAFSSGEQGASFECRFDGGAFSACSSPLISSPLSDGPHSFEVRATDVAANTDPSPASRSFTVDTVAPDTSIAGPLGLTKDPTPTFADTQPPDAKLSGTGGQIAGEPIEVEVSCAEDCAVVATGKILVWGAANRPAAARAAREEAKFGLKKVAKQLIAGETATLKLRPKSWKARLKLKRLVRSGEKARAGIGVKFTDRAGNSRTSGLTVRLQRR